MPPTQKKKAARKAPVRTKSFDPLTLILYAESGNGKTTLAANFPKAGFICDSQELGIHFLDRYNLVPPPVWIKDDYNATADKKSWKTVWPRLLNDIYDAALDNSIETLVVESITGIEKICFYYVCADSFDGNYTSEGFFNYQRGPKNAAQFEWPNFVDALQTVHNSGKTVIVTAHSKEKEVNRVEGGKHMMHVPHADKDIWAGIHRWASGVFYLGKDISTNRSERGLKKVANEDFERVMYVDGTPYCEAKNWLGLTGKVQLGNSGQEAYANLLKELRNGRK